MYKLLSFLLFADAVNPTARPVFELGPGDFEGPREVPFRTASPGLRPVSPGYVPTAEDIAAQRALDPNFDAENEENYGGPPTMAELEEMQAVLDDFDRQSLEDGEIRSTTADTGDLGEREWEEGEEGLTPSTPESAVSENGDVNNNVDAPRVSLLQLFLHEFGRTLEEMIEFSTSSPYLVDFVLDIDYHTEIWVDDARDNPELFNLRIGNTAERVGMQAFLQTFLGNAMRINRYRIEMESEERQELLSSLISLIYVWILELPHDAADMPAWRADWPFLIDP
jgi:hypothetical protein